jgi:hypothetical protein
MASASKWSPWCAVRYRYKSPVLYGRWHSDPDAACSDAVRAGQATRRGDGTIAWRVGAALESDHLGAVPRLIDPFARAAISQS